MVPVASHQGELELVAVADDEERLDWHWRRVRGVVVWGVTLKVGGGERKKRRRKEAGQAVESRDNVDKGQNSKFRHDLGSGYLDDRSRAQRENCILNTRTKGMISQKNTQGRVPSTVATATGRRVAGCGASSTA